MLSYQTIHPNTLELLKSLTKEPLFSELRLVGGTSLALQYGHRNSIDLDFFGKIEASDEDLLEVLRKYGNLQIIKLSTNIKLFVLNGIKVDIVNYSYPWIDTPVCEDELILASPKDIAAMKVNAIEGRGTKKDFIDIFELLKHYSLTEILAFHKEKYPESSTFRALMSLSYFEDTEGQPMPQMFISDTWEDMKKQIINIVTSLK